MRECVRGNLLEFFVKLSLQGPQKYLKQTYGIVTIEMSGGGEVRLSLFRLSLSPVLWYRPSLSVFATKHGSKYFTHGSSFIFSHYHGVGTVIYPRVADVAQRQSVLGLSRIPSNDSTASLSTIKFYHLSLQEPRHCAGWSPDHFFLQVRIKSRPSFFLRG